MKKVLVFICIAISIAQVSFSQPPPPFNPWLVNVDPISAPQHIADMMKFVDIMPITDPLQFTPPCYDSPLDSCANWDIWKYDTALAIHPNYPCCPILIKYKFRVCASNPKIRQHYILSFVIGIKANDTCCTALKNYLNTGVSTWDADHQAQFEHDLNALMARQRFVEFNEGLMNADPCCRDTLYCTNPDGTPKYDHVRISYVKGACRGCCVGYYTFDDGSVGWSYAPKDCPATECCKVVNKFCIDRLTGNLIHTEEKSQLPAPPECLSNPMSEIECYNTWSSVYAWPKHLEDTWVVPCKPTCNLNFLDLGGDKIVH
jgi:hypothetical protein